MKWLILTLVAFLQLRPAFAQSANQSIESRDLTIEGLKFKSSKEEIIARFGKPQRIFEPNYECGFLTGEETGDKIYTLQYPLLKFTGNERDAYLLEEIRFNSKFAPKILYRGRILGSSTSVVEFQSIFNVKVEEGSQMLYFKGADDALLFSFDKGYLVSIKYWSPC